MSKILLLLLLGVSSCWAISPPTETEPAPKVTIEAALAIAEKAAKEQLKDLPGVYCAGITVIPLAMLPPGPRPIWSVTYRLPGNKRDFAAEKLGQRDIWGDGEIIVHDDGSVRVRQPRIIK